jgi:hypothetical protein
MLQATRGAAHLRRVRRARCRRITGHGAAVLGAAGAARDARAERPGVQLVATFYDGPALFDAIVELGLEGVVAKRERDPYRRGERVWVKHKNKAMARFAEERDGVGRRHAARV